MPNINIFGYEDFKSFVRDNTQSAELDELSSAKEVLFWARVEGLSKHQQSYLFSLWIQANPQASTDDVGHLSKMVIDASFIRPAAPGEKKAGGMWGGIGI